MRKQSEIAYSPSASDAWSDEEIRANYRQAKNKQHQITIISDLTLRPKQEIMRILSDDPSLNWTDDQKRFLLDHPSHKNADYMDKIGKTATEVAVMKDFLGIRPVRANKKWTRSEEKWMMDALENGHSYEDIMAHLERPYHSITSHVHQLKQAQKRKEIP